MVVNISGLGGFHSFSFSCMVVSMTDEIEVRRSTPAMSSEGNESKHASNVGGHIVIIFAYFSAAGGVGSGGIFPKSFLA